MRARTVLLTLSALAVAPPAADAHITVQPGQTLSGIAAANGVSPATLAAANGLSADAFVIAGQSLAIPAPGTAPAATPAAPAASTTPTTAAPAPAPAAATSGSGGTYIQPGDTLSAIAARLGTTPAALAAANGIMNPNIILAGTTLRPATGGPAAPAAAPATSSTGPEGTPAATGVGAAPTAERLSSGQISQIAAQHGAPGDLAAAIAWQESGNNNALTSSAGARGIMQVMPGTWDWINRALARPPLNRASASDNVRAGSLLLGQLLKETGGDVPTAVAGYYQGLGSVRRNGMFADTRRYVANVMALRGRVG